MEISLSRRRPEIYWKWENGENKQHKWKRDKKYDYAASGFNIISWKCDVTDPMLKNPHSASLFTGVKMKIKVVPNLEQKQEDKSVLLGAPVQLPSLQDSVEPNIQLSLMT